MESLQAKAPLYSTKPVSGVANTPYEFFLDSYGSAPELLGSGALARVWAKGVIKATVDVALASDLGDCSVDDCGWHIGNLESSGAFTPVNEIGAFVTASPTSAAARRVSRLPALRRTARSGRVAPRRDGPAARARRHRRSVSQPSLRRVVRLIGRLLLLRVRPG